MNKRILSIDVFRGLTILAMIIVNNPGSWNYVYAPLQHASWHGCTPTDLVFPFFMFIVGLSMSISYRRSNLSNQAWVIKSMKRMALIFSIGLLLNWFPFYHKSFSDLRLFGVLQRIALAFGFSALIIAIVKDKYIPYLVVGILLVYWLMMFYLGGPLPFSLEDNLVRQIDLAILTKSHMYTGFGIAFDPEGLFNTLPAIASVLIGFYFVERMGGINQLKNHLRSNLCMAMSFVIIGLIWHYFECPINKPLWTSSYVFLTSGLAMLCFLFCYWLIDEKGFKVGVQFLNVFGRNPLFAFTSSILLIKILLKIKIDGGSVYQYAYLNGFQKLGNYSGSLVQAFTFTLIVWLLCFLLYKKDLMLKV